MTDSKLALLGGEKAVTDTPPELFRWPIVNEAMEEAVLKVLRAGSMSGKDLTYEFERMFAEWHGMEYAVAHSSGTAALQAAMYAVGLGPGDEIIVPSITYWASAVPALSLGASVIFADIEPDSLCIDPTDAEKRITPRTKAIEVVHYAGMPADMDALMALAEKHDLKVLEDVSHAHGALYKGKMVGTFGDVSAFSCMSGKSLAIGEGGILLTDQRSIYERTLIFGHYSRQRDITDPELKAGLGLPWGGYKYRMHQMSSAVAIEQMKKYPREMEEIDRAMNYYWDGLEGVPGIRAHRPEKGSGSTKGGWYASHGHYVTEELGGLSANRFAEAVSAEGSVSGVGCNAALHQHPLFSTIDIYGHGRPTQGLYLPEDVDARQDRAQLPVSDGIQPKVFRTPWFKKFMPEVIDQHIEAYRKVAENYEELLPGDESGKEEAKGQWGLTFRS